jgi:hypothetical protein
MKPNFTGGRYALMKRVRQNGEILAAVTGSRPDAALEIGAVGVSNAAVVVVVAEATQATTTIIKPLCVSD